MFAVEVAMFISMSGWYLEMDRDLKLMTHFPFAIHFQEIRFFFVCLMW